MSRWSYAGIDLWSVRRGGLPGTRSRKRGRGLRPHPPCLCGVRKRDHFAGLLGHTYAPIGKHANGERFRAVRRS